MLSRYITEQREIEMEEAEEEEQRQKEAAEEALALKEGRECGQSAKTARHSVCVFLGVTSRCRKPGRTKRHRRDRAKYLARDI